MKLCPKTSKTEERNIFFYFILPIFSDYILCSAKDIV